MKAYFRRELEKHPDFANYTDLAKQKRAIFFKLANIINRNVSEKVIKNTELTRILVAEKDWLKDKEKKIRFSEGEIIDMLKKNLKTNRPYTFIGSQTIQRIWTDNNSNLQERPQKTLFLFLEKANTTKELESFEIPKIIENKENINDGDIKGISKPDFETIHYLIPERLLKILVGEYKIIYSYKNEVKDFNTIKFIQENTTNLKVIYQSKSGDLEGWGKYFTDEVLYIELTDKYNSYAHHFRFKVNTRLPENFEVLIGLGDGATHDNKLETSVILCLLKLTKDDKQNQVNIKKIINSDLWNCQTNNTILMQPSKFLVDNFNQSLLGISKPNQNISETDNNGKPNASFSKMEKKEWYPEIIEGLAGVYETYKVDKTEKILHKSYFLFDKSGNIKWKPNKKIYQYAYIDTFLQMRRTFKLNILGYHTQQPFCTYIISIPKKESLLEPKYLITVFMAAVENTISIGKSIFIKIKDTNFDDLAPESCELDSEECLEWRKKYPQIDEYLFQKNDFVEEWF